ncbi:chaperonin 10-like protein [Ilyonectria destructans]|nr:chaperonin 10-like protein [Ilyonectria destructans]
MKALVLTPSTREAAVRELSRPVPGVGEVLIRVHAVALNPVDSLYVSHPIAIQEYRVIGTDFAGIVVGASPELAGSPDPRTKSGGRVAGFLQGACSVNDRPGAFAEYITAPYDLVWNVPKGLSLEAASAVSMCGLTAAQGVFVRLGLPSPFASSSGALPVENRDTHSPINVFIYGSSTSLGLYAAQLVRLSFLASGRKIRLIGAASASKHDFLRKAPYSYDALVDYRDSDWPDKVREATAGAGVDYAIDCISEGATVEKVHSTFGPQGRFAVFRSPGGGGFDTSRLRVKPIYGAVWEGLGVEIGYNGQTIPASPPARDFATKFFAFLSSGAEEGKINLEPNPLRIMPGGLKRVVPDGFTLLGGDGVTSRTTTRGESEHMRPISAEKMVYVIE